MSQKLILVLNCGSSSLKGAVLDNGSGEVLLSCLAEKLNLPDAYITFKVNGEKHKVDLSAHPDHTGAVEALMEELEAHGLDSRIGAIGHRVVSGGELYNESILVDDEVIAGIEKCIPLALCTIPPTSWPACRAKHFQRPAQRRRIRYLLPPNHARSRLQIRRSAGVV